MNFSIPFSRATAMLACALGFAVARPAAADAPAIQDLSGAWRLDGNQRLTYLRAHYQSADTFPHPELQDWLELKLADTRVEPAPDGNGQLVTMDYTGTYNLHFQGLRYEPSLGKDVPCFDRGFAVPIGGPVTYLRRDLPDNDGATYEYRVQLGTVDNDASVFLGGWSGDGPPPYAYDPIADQTFSDPSGRALQLRLVVGYPWLITDDFLADFEASCETLWPGTTFYGGIEGGGEPWWVTRIEPLPPEQRIVGSIAGFALEATPDGAVTQTPIGTATLAVLAQHRHVPARQPGQSLADYHRFVRNATHEVARTRIETTAAGAFEFDELPAFSPAGTQLYTIELVGGETDEVDPDTGEIIPLHFVTSFAPNIRVGADGTVAGLPFAAIEAKQHIVDTLSAAGPYDLAIAEQPVSVMLEQIRSGALATTAARSEAVDRAIWAERTVHQATSQAEPLIAAMLDGGGVFIADLLDRQLLSRRDARAIADDRRQASRLRESLGWETWSRGGWQTLDDVSTRAARLRASLEAVQGRNRIAVSETLRVVRSMIGVITAEMRSILIATGMDSARAIDLTRYLKTTMYFLCDVGVHQSLLGGTKELVKEAIKLALRSAADDLYNGDLSFSFTNLVRPHLDHSATQMAAWDRADRSVYAADREKAIDAMRAIGNDASGALSAAIMLRAAGEAAWTTETLLSVIDPFLPKARLVRRAAEAAKFAFNGASALVPAATVYGEMLRQVDIGVHAAYGQPPSAMARAPVSRVGVAPNADLDSEIDAALVDFESANDRLVELLESDLPFDALAATAGDEGGWIAALDAFDEALGVRVAEASAALEQDGVDADEARALAARTYELAASSADALDRAQALYVGVIDGGFAGPDDPAWTSARDEVLATLLALGGESRSVAEDALALEVFSTKPVVLLRDVEIVAETSTTEDITATNERVVVRATVVNHGTVTVDGLGARMQPVAARGSLTGAATVAVPALAPGDEHVVEWTLTYAGDLEDELMYVTADLVEGDALPEGVYTLPVHRDVRIDPEIVDAELDGMADALERELGLDPTIDDYADDLDGDAITNGRELRLGLDASRADSDEDGLDDREELVLGADGRVTEPLVADSDDDGALDGADPDPRDASPEAPPSAVVPLALWASTDALELDADHGVATFEVEATGGRGAVVVSDNESLVRVVTAGPIHGRRSIVLERAAGFDLERTGTATVRVRVLAVGDTQAQEITVTVRGRHTWTPTLEGHSVGAGDDGCGCRTNGSAVPSWATLALLIVARRRRGRDERPRP